MSDISNLALLVKFAPMVHVNPSETYLPCSVDWFVQRCQLLDASGTVQVASPAVKDLPDTTFGQRFGWHLAINDTATYPLTTTILGQPASELQSVPAYGYVRTIANHDTTQFYDLDYWLFFGYNGNTANLTMLNTALGAATAVSLLNLPLGIVSTCSGNSFGAALVAVNQAGGVGLHQGDWVLATVRLTADQTKIDSMYLQQHNSGSWYKSGGFTTTKDGRPIVYAALASHELYPAAGTVDRLKGFASDVCADATGTQYLWDTSTTVVDIGWNPNMTGELQAVGGPYGGFPSGYAALASGEEIAVFAQSNNPGFKIAVGSGWTRQNFTPTAAPTLWNGTSTVQQNVISPSPGLGSPMGLDSAVVGPSTPAVAVNNSGAVLVAYLDTSNNCVCGCGQLNEVSQTISWTNSGSGTKLGISGNSNSVPSISMTDVLAGASCVWVSAVLGAQYHIAVGDYDLEKQSLTSWSLSQNTYGGHTNSNPSIAINKSGYVVEVHDADKGTLYIALGEADHVGKTFRWLTDEVAFGHGYYNPIVSINDKGAVLVIATNNNKKLYYFSGVITPTGVVFSSTAGTNTLPNSDITAGLSLALREDFSCLLLCTDSGNLYLNNLAGMFTEWAAPAGYEWCKYSGHFGGSGDAAPIFDVFGTTVWVNGDAPDSPTARPIYQYGPPDYPATQAAT